MAAVASEISALAQPTDDAGLRAEVQAYLDRTYPDIASLCPSPSVSAGGSRLGASHDADAGPSTPPNDTPLSAAIAHWRAAESTARTRLAAAESALPRATADAVAALEGILDRAQSISLARYELSDAMGALVAQVRGADVLGDEGVRGGDGGEGEDVGDVGDGDTVMKETATLVERIEVVHAALGRSEAALAWAKILERVLVLRDKTLDPASHRPSPLSALPSFRALASSVADMEATLPAGMALLASLRAVRDDTWAQLKRVLGDTLVRAAEEIGWPRRVDYAAAAPEKRRRFERCYTEMLYFEAEGERLGQSDEGGASGNAATGANGANAAHTANGANGANGTSTNADPTPQSPWATGKGLYPLQALVRPVALRFKYHFQGSRNTNRVDKPEWALGSIQDTIYEHAEFISDYLQPLTARAGYGGVDVKSEFTMLLLPTLLAFLRTRIPHLLSHPALLAHTVYQTVLFDDAVRESGFDLARTSVYRGVPRADVPDWEGLTGAILREQDWFEQWLEGERKFAETTLNEIISSPTAWTITDARDDDGDDDAPSDGDDGVLATESARQMRALLEQITDRYAPLPALEYRAAFLRRVQLPVLGAYHTRLAGSLDAFETLSNAFVRAVGQRDDSRLQGTQGLDRLVKAYVSAEYILNAVRVWADDVLFAEMSADLAALTPGAPPSSVWDPSQERFGALCRRAEDMIVRLVCAEVEGDMTAHVQRRWDSQSGIDPGADAALNELASVTSHARALTAFTTLISALAAALPRPAALRTYRRIATHLATHIANTCVWRGRTKFSVAGARALAAELDDWRGAATQALRTLPPPPTGAVDAPWRQLQDMATLLALPNEHDDKGGKDDAPTFPQAMAAAWGGGASLDAFQGRVGVRMGQHEMQAVLRRRGECWR